MSPYEKHVLAAADLRRTLRTSIHDWEEMRAPLAIIESAKKSLPPVVIEIVLTMHRTLGALLTNFDQAVSLVETVIEENQRLRGLVRPSGVTS